MIAHALRRIETALAVRAERDRQARDDTARRPVEVVKTDADGDHAARRSAKMASSAPCSSISFARVGCDLWCFQREGVVGATPARSQIAIIGTRASCARWKSSAKGSYVCIIRHTIGRLA